MSFFGDAWKVINSIDFSRQLNPGGSFVAAGPAKKYNPYINRNAPNSLVPSPPALSERDAISNFRQGERDSINAGGSAYGNQFPSMAEIMARLEELQNPGRYAMDPNQLLQQARAQASAQYDPVIAQLRQQMGSAQNRGSRNKQALGEMFGQLSSNLQGDIPRIQQTFAGTKQETQGQYDQLRGNIEGTYKETQADQEAMLKRLGIEAAAPDVFDQQFKDRDYFTSLANKEGQTAQTALGTEERGATEYTRRGSEQALTEGTQRQADLMTQLQDLLSSYESQIGSNEAAKAQAVQAGLGQLQQQSQQQAMQNSQRDFDNYLKSIQLGRDLRGDELNQILKGQVTKVSSPADVAGRALTMGLPQGNSQRIQDVFNDAVASDPIILSGLSEESGQTAPKEALAARITQKGREMGLSQQELNALQTIALEYFGRS